MRIGLYGGSFNPVHHGHLVAARFAGEALGLERVILLPSASPPHKDPGAVGFAPATARMEMLRLATCGDGLLEVGDQDLTRVGPTYTVETVEGYQREHPTAELFWIVGGDSVGHLHAWHRAADLMALCQITVVRRPDFSPVWWRLRAELSATAGRQRAERLVDGIIRHVVDSPGFAVSATLVRERVRAGLPIRYLVPEAVASYIASTGLYGPDFRV
jgi:nicotinate-nucleotide adenylyltransferase